MLWKNRMIVFRISIFLLNSFLHRCFGWWLFDVVVAHLPSFFSFVYSCYVAYNVIFFFSSNGFSYVFWFYFLIFFPAIFFYSIRHPLCSLHSNGMRMIESWCWHKIKDTERKNKREKKTKMKKNKRKHGALLSKEDESES